MEVCETSVTLGYTVCAVREYADRSSSDVRNGIGASGMASGRKPSMERIKTRRARGVGVGVMEGLRVVVAVGRRVAVGVCVGVSVGRMGAACSWQVSAVRQRLTINLMCDIHPL